MQTRPLGAEVSSVWLMTGGFPEVKVISFGLHKHRHGRNVRVEKLYLYCFSRRLQKQGDTMCWLLLKLFLFIAAIMIMIIILIFIIIMIMMAMICMCFLRSRQTLRDTVTTRELKTIACPLQTNTFDMRSISVCLFNFKPTWGPLTWSEFFLKLGHCFCLSQTLCVHF